MIPKNNLVDRNTNVIQIATALIKVEDYEVLHHLGELIKEQHVSLITSFNIITNRVDDVKIQALRDELEEIKKRELAKK